MSNGRKFHVEITMTKTVEVEVTDDMMSDDEDIEEVAQEVALMNFGSSAHTFDEDYQVESIREITVAESPK